MKRMSVKNREIGTGRPLICVPVMEEKREDVIKEITYLTQSRADMIEWRVDTYEGFQDCNAVRDILEAVAPILKEKLFLYTFRTKKQGGEANVDSETLEDLHDLAAESGCVDFIDLEFFEVEKPMRRIKDLQSKGIRVIASHHDFEGTPVPEVMKMLLERMCAGGADLVKLAVMPHSRKDVLSLLEVTSDFFCAYPDTPVITMSMGGMGNISRLCGENFGSCVTFGAHKRASAPGQMEMNALADILDTIHKSNGNKI